ncbi:MAG TPA: benzoate-CoA ligase family protein [Stellaceae bacterium]|nr:benzoate-CoA ligase family protein [Stellaceae bacterium]
MTKAPVLTSMNACDALLGPTLAAGHGLTPALIHRDARYTYAELEALVNRFGNALAGSGVGRGDRVLLLLKDTPEFVAAFLAAMKVGGVAVTLNTRSAARDVRFAITDSACRAMVIDREFLDLFDEAVADGGLRPPVLVVCCTASEPAAPAISLGAFLKDRPDRLESAPMSPDDMAFWIYTSGTTGTPKAAVHCHHDLLLGDLHVGEILGIKRGDRVFSSSKLFFSFALTFCLLGGLRMGATLILEDRWPDSDAVAETVRRHRPDVMFSVPTIYRNLLRDAHAKEEAFGAVRRYVSAGEKLPASLFERWRQATGKPILEGIGATETLFLFIANTPTAFRAGATGRPQPGVELRLLDERNQPVTEPGVTGVLWVRMSSLCRGYWQQPEKTAASFVDGWYRTGDVFSFDSEGWWYHHGRGDDLLKISGQWVSPVEIEDCALATTGILDAAVVGVENADGLVRLAMFAVPADSAGGPELAAQIQERIKSQLSIYKCPRNIRFVEEIPRTATGKIQRFRLRELANELRPEREDAPAPSIGAAQPPPAAKFSP